MVQWTRRFITSSAVVIYLFNLVVFGRVCFSIVYMCLCDTWPSKELPFVICFFFFFNKMRTVPHCVPFIIFGFNHKWSKTVNISIYMETYFEVYIFHFERFNELSNRLSNSNAWKLMHLSLSLSVCDFVWSQF